MTGKLVKCVDSKWQSVADEDAYKLTKLEGQVMSAQLLMLWSSWSVRKHLCEIKLLYILLSCSTHIFNSCQTTLERQRIKSTGNCFITSDCSANCGDVLES